MFEENPAKEELKRVDHLIYVTLKYTRTCDVIKNTVERLINAFEAIFEVGLEYAKKKKKIKVIPDSNRMKAEVLYKVCNKRGIKKYFELYELLRNLYVAEFGRKEEYRKHVAMVCNLDSGKIVEVDIPTLMEYYNQTKEFVKIVDEWAK